jgi:hypothetical protein
MVWLQGQDAAASGEAAEAAKAAGGEGGGLIQGPVDRRDKERHSNDRDSDDRRDDGPDDNARHDNARHDDGRHVDGRHVDGRRDDDCHDRGWRSVARLDPASARLSAFDEARLPAFDSVLPDRPAFRSYPPAPGR